MTKDKRDFQKARFIVSFNGIKLLKKPEPLFIAEPFINHLIDVHKLRVQFPKIEVAPYIRKNPEDLRTDNALLWEKYNKYLPLLSESLNKVNGTNLSDDFWRRSLSMGLMRHLTMVFDLFKICDKYFDPYKHSAYLLSTDNFYIPVNYDEHRWFFQHSNFGQEQLFSLYLHFFHDGYGNEYQEHYSSLYTLPRIYANENSDPIVGIMRALFNSAKLKELVASSNGDVASIGYDTTFPVSERISWDKRALLECSEIWFDRFDKFFFYSLPVLMPRQFVEDFHSIFNSLYLQLGKYQKLRYVVSETFIGESNESIALAILSIRGVKVVYNEHNYSEYPFYSSILDQQTSFADIFAAHGNYEVPIKHKISTGSLFEFSQGVNEIPKKKYSILYTSSIGNAKYSNYSHSFAETGEHAKYYYDFKLEFFKALSAECRNEILYREYPLGDNNAINWTLYYNDSFLMRDFIPRMIIDDHSQSNKIRMLQSRLIIVDYLSTSHFESMSMNIPTILLIRLGSYQLNENNKDFFDALIDVGICQTDPVKAANFIESVRYNPEEWWSKPEVQAAKDNFLEKNLGKPEYLTNFLLNLVQEKDLTIGTQMKTPIDKFIRDHDGVFQSPDIRKDFAYSDGEDRENLVLQTILTTQDRSILSEELHKKINDWVTEYHFSRERHNLLRHIDFQQEWNILELGCGCGAITRQLGETGASVTAVEGSYDRARSAAARCKDLENVKVFCSNFQDIGIQKKYDVVTLIGVLEYSPQFFMSEDPIGECLKIAYNALKATGVLIIAIENQLGLKYLSGYHEDHVDIPFFGVEDRYNSKTAVTFGKKELENILKSAGFADIEFQYPFPDYKIPKLLLTSQAFSTPAFSPEAILSQLKYRDYSGEVHPTFEQELAIPVLCRNGIMEDVSNSFLVFATPASRLSRNFSKDEFLGAFYTTDRVPDLNVKTIFSISDNTITTTKEPLFPKFKNYIRDGVIEHIFGSSKYISGSNLEIEYRKCILTKDIRRFSELMELQISFMEKYGISKMNYSNKALSIIHPDFIDCIPANLIYFKGTLRLIDQEWKVKRDVSIGALLLRTVDAIRDYEKLLPELTKENLLFSLNDAGYCIDEKILQEYNTLIEDIVRQVYTGITRVHLSVPDDAVSNSLYTIRNELLQKKQNYPSPIPVIERLLSHIDTIFKMQAGDSYADYFEQIKLLGKADTTEFDICKQIYDALKDSPEWQSASKFLQVLLRSISKEMSTNQTINNQIEFHKKFYYGTEFKKFICPNPFLYMELRQDNEVSSCCYLPFTLGNIEGGKLNQAWNSEISQELRKSILNGDYSYCDKSKCAAMQEVSHPKNKNVLNYQIPYQLFNKSEVSNPILRNAILTGNIINLPTPEIISFEDDPSCNLSCPSCRTSIISINTKESGERLTSQINMLDSLGMHLKELWLCGAGDPFAAASYRKLLLQYDFSKFPELGFRLDTNGILFNQHLWDTTLKNIQDRIKLVAVSIDAATEVTYSEIRRGGNFQTILKNLAFISGLPQRKKGMLFIIRMIVQAKNFSEMKQFIELGKSFGVDSVVFFVMQNWGTFLTEEYKTQAIHLAEHPSHNELLTILKDDIFNDPIVNIGNLLETHINATGGHQQFSMGISSTTTVSIDTALSSNPRARVIAFYLPQFHPIPENDIWWGKGFTEWSNVGKAKQLYEGHYQPHIPADLGYYDLRLPETREAQAELAKNYGVEAFCYWHYWFAGHRLLERPFNDVVSSGKPDFPFCLGWANQTWSGIWHGAPNKILIEQTYPGIEDYQAHFYALLNAFQDSRYLKINGKLVFLIYSPQNLPNAEHFTYIWQELAIKERLPGFHFIAHMAKNPEQYGCETCVDNAPFYDMKVPQLDVKPANPNGVPRINDYSELVLFLNSYKLGPNEYPLVFPNWDNTPRSGANGLVLHNSTPELFMQMLENAIQKIENITDFEHRLVFIKAWNEWAEGNHLEPDLKYGHAYLEAIRNTIYIKSK